MFNHDGVKTNNHAEGYNSRLGSKKQISKHPNPYTLVQILKEEFQKSEDDCVAASVDNASRRKRNTKLIKLSMRRENQMTKLKEGNLDLMSYQKSIGGFTICLDKRIREYDDHEGNEPLEALTGEIESCPDIDIPNLPFTLNDDQSFLLDQIPSPSQGINNRKRKETRGQRGKRKQLQSQL